MDDNYEIYHELRGQLVSKYFKRRCVEEALDYRPRDGDRLLITYPKSGTMWCDGIVQYIIHAHRQSLRVTGADDNNNNNNNNTHNRAYNINTNFLEYSGLSALTANTTPDDTIRFAYTHIPGLLLSGQSSDTKYLMVIRNPKDVFASYHHFMRGIYGADNWPLSKTLKHILPVDDGDNDLNNNQSGLELWFGDYFHSIRKYWLRRAHPLCTVLVYERMLEDKPAAVRAIAAFLGPEFERTLDRRLPSAETADNNGCRTVMDRIVAQTSLTAMSKANPKPELSAHFRKGGSGGWRSVLTREQSDWIDRRVREEWKGTGLESLWVDEMRW